LHIAIVVIGIIAILSSFIYDVFVGSYIISGMLIVLGVVKILAKPFIYWYSRSRLFDSITLIVLGLILAIATYLYQFR
jgi:hypothetical protein